MEGGVRARKLGGGRICLVSMSGMDIPSRMLSGFRIVHLIMLVADQPTLLRCFPWLDYRYLCTKATYYKLYARGGPHPVVISTAKYREVFGTFKCKTRERWGGWECVLNWIENVGVESTHAARSCQGPGGQGEKCELKYNDFIQGKNMDDHAKKKKKKRKEKSEKYDVMGDCHIESSRYEKACKNGR